MAQSGWYLARACSGPVKTPSVNLLHPVECVSWFECIAVLSRLGLTLPRENEWEWAARAGTTSVWWLGNDPAALSGKANLQSVGHCPVSLYDFPKQLWALRCYR